MQRPPRPADDDDRLRAAVPRRRRLPAAGRRPVRRGAGGRRAGRTADRDRPRGAVGRLRPGGDRGLPRGAWRRFARRAGGTVTEVDFAGREHVLIASILVGSDRGARRRDPRARRRARRGREPDRPGAACATGCCFPPWRSPRRCGCAPWCGARSPSCSSRSTCSPGRRSPAPAPPLDNPTVELPSGAYPADYVNPRQAGIANLAGVPAISVPVGLELRGAADRAAAARRLGPRRAAARRRGGARASQRAPVGGRRAAAGPPGLADESRLYPPRDAGDRGQRAGANLLGRRPRRRRRRPRGRRGRDLRLPRARTAPARRPPSGC